MDFKVELLSPLDAYRWLGRWIKAMSGISIRLHGFPDYVLELLNRTPPLDASVPPKSVLKECQTALYDDAIPSKITLTPRAPKTLQVR